MLDSPAAPPPATHTLGKKRCEAEQMPNNIYMHIKNMSADSLSYKPPVVYIAALILSEHTLKLQAEWEQWVTSTYSR